MSVLAQNWRADLIPSTKACSALGRASEAMFSRLSIPGIFGTMSIANHLARAQKLRSLAHELETLSDAVEQPSRSLERAERLIGEGERISREIYAVFRGPRC